MSLLGRVHLLSALIAIAAGAAVLLRPKGTRWHRRVGRLYGASMLVLNGTALAIYRLTGSFGPFHVAAFLSLAVLTAGIVPAMRRRPVGSWLARHYYFTSHSYVGLLAAAVAETSTRLVAAQLFAERRPTLWFWTAVAGASVVVIATGTQVISRRAARSMARVARA